MTDIEITTEMLYDFFEDMNTWESSSFSILQQNPKDAHHILNTFKIAKEKLEIIYAKYLTQKEREYTNRNNSISSNSAYDKEKEKIVSAIQKSKSRIEFETFKNDVVGMKNQYVFLKENDHWKLDNKKTFWNFKNKWESTVI